MTDFSTTSPAETEALGASFMASCRTPRLVLLTGPLGAGKTCFVRGMAGAIGVEASRVRSPTFVLHHVYRSDGRVLHHLDLYRLGDGAALAEFDLDELLEEGTVVIEWGELGKLPDRFDPWKITFSMEEDERRCIRIPDDAGVPAFPEGVA